MSETIAHICSNRVFCSLSDTSQIGKGRRCEMAQALHEQPRRISDYVNSFQENDQRVARAKLRRLLELEASKRREGLDSSEKRERLQLRSTLRSLAPEIYLEYLSRQDEEAVAVRPVGVSLSDEVRSSSRELFFELQQARQELSTLNRRRRRADRMRLRPPSGSTLPARRPRNRIQADSCHDRSAA